MSFEAEKIYNLLPAVHRTRDAEQGYPLRQLVEVIASQVAVLEENIEQLYDNQFVETAAPWALPYLGDLLGIRGLPTGRVARSSRAEVGHTVGYRRRKGTAPMLELLARDVTGWPARAVEFFERLAATQYLNHLRPKCRSFASLRGAKELEFVGTPFEPLTRTVEVRRIAPGLGKWNIPNVGLFLWRLRVYSRTASPLVPVGDLRPGDPLARRRFRLHPFGFEVQLFSRPVTEEDITHLAEPINVPLPISRRSLANDTAAFHPSESFYGSGLSVALAEFTGGEYHLLPAERVIVCDLSDARDAANQPVWNHESNAAGNQAALDPVLGRVVFGTALTDPAHPPRGTFHYGFSFDLGGGEYGRAGSLALQRVRPITVAQMADADFATLSGALAAPAAAVPLVQILDGGRYVEALPDLTATAAREIRAADEKCPVVLLRPAGGGQPWTIRGDANGGVTLNGLWLVGALRVADELGRFTLRHCTIAPGWGVGADGSIVAAPDAHLEISSGRTQVVIENCILPPLRVGEDNVRVLLRNCIVDAGAENRFALSNLAADGPAGTWRLENCTVIGKVALDALELGSNCIFLGESVVVRRRQEGCARFSWLPRHPQTRTPRRYQCLPSESGANAGVRPQFTSLAFGHPAYAQLSRRCPGSIRAGADDGAEMGAFHDLFQPQREAHLRARLAENLRFTLEAGVFYES
jgi:hypothetical protein